MQSLCNEVYSKGNDYYGATLITESIKINLKEEFARFFHEEWSSTDCPIKSYIEYVINTVMHNWIKQNKA